MPAVDTLLLSPIEDAAAAARILADAGMDGVYTFEGPADPFGPLVLAAGATDLAVYTNVALAFVRSPMALAYQAWDLQRLCGGRFLLGLGTQVRANVEDRYGMAFARPVDRMRDTVEALHAIFARWQDGVTLDHRGPFWRHTLMQPTFDPGPLPGGQPPVLVGALGPRMTKMAGECADGLLVHPVNTPRYLAEVTVPEFAAGTAAAGRARNDHTVVADVMVAAGRDDREMDAAIAGVRSLLGFYLSTPAYAAPLRAYGWEGVQPELNRLSKQGRWDEMATLVDDEMLDALAVVGDPAEIGRKVASRFEALAPDRVAFYCPYAAPPDLVAEIATSIRTAV